MIRLDEDSLICDLAETYNIYDYKQLPLMQVAVFAYGLREDSRIRKKLSKSKVDTTELLLSGILDRLSLLVYAQTKDAQKGVNRPAMLVDGLLKTESEIQGFNSSEEFENRRKRILENIQERG
ncbi:DUF5361 domain-containing protein [Peptoniphilus asaccharolyticus]